MSWLPESIRNSTSTISVAASQTNQVVGKPTHLTAQGARRLRADFFLGRVTEDSGATGIALKLQTNTGYNIWNDQATDTSFGTKAAADTFTAATTDICTATSHGFSDGAAFVVDSSTTLPAGLSTKTAYFVKVIDVNTFYLHTAPNFSTDSRVNITDTGTGTHSMYAVTQISIALEDTTATIGGQSYTPMEHRIRAVCTTGAGDSVDILDVMLTQAD